MIFNHLKCRGEAKDSIKATSDGASVNTEIYRGVLTQLKRERPWLITFHYISNGIKLALKDAINVLFLKDAEELFETT